MKGEELKAWRELQGKSQKELADALDVSRHSVIKWEQEEQIPRLVELAVSALDRDSPLKLVAGRASSPEEVVRTRELFDRALAGTTGRES
ncbi:helix-turn-helix transcriptional regulator [Rhizobium sp. NRK18]|uniref:helix-turn-helix transcriptional regulator n=1 Tax=Rhizobium sp. NRK18 TaxID=2964667 RepID=UPI003965A1CF